ncbi:MAG: hypothetical protein ACO25T_08795, partial [Arenimonas sp.]
MKWPVEVAPTLNTLYGTKMGLEDQHAFGGAGLFVPVISASNSQEHAAITVDFASTLTALHEQPYIAVPQTLDQDVCGTITAGFGKLGAPEVDAYTAIPVAMTPEQATDRQTFTASIGDFKEDEVAKTILRNTGAGGETQNPAWVIEPVVYESHPNDSRVTGPVEQCPTVAARWGTGGNNTPLVQQAIGFDPTGSTADPMNEMIPAIRGVSGGNAGHHVGVAVQQPMAFTHSGYSNQPAWITGDRTDCLSAGGHSDTSHQGIGIIESVQQPMAMHTVSESGDVSSTLRTGWNADVFNIVSVQQPMAMRESGQGYWMQDEVIGTIRAEGENRPSRPSNVVAVQQPIAMINMQGSKGNAVAQVSDQSFTLNAMHGHDVHAVAVQQAMASDPVQVQWASGGGQVENPTAQALRSGAEHNYQFVRHEMAVRRLTPVECERLQGFPD